MAPPANRNSSGSTKLKKAALGLRQNMRRSSRYWRQHRRTGLTPCTASGIGGQLQVDVLERRALDRELLQALAARERRAGQLVQERGGVIRLALHELAVAVAVCDAVVGCSHAQLARRSDGQHA